MPRLVIPHYTVIRDTREQEGHGWVFRPTPDKSHPPKCLGMVVNTLKTGDYSASGYEDLLTIERKWDFTELWGNYHTRKRFENEMDRMSQFRYAYVLIETFITKEAFKLSPPQYRTAVPGTALIEWLIGLTMKFGVHIFMVGDCGRKVATQIIENVIHLEKDRWIESDARQKQEASFSD